MSRTVTVGLNGSPESLAAADWAAREALLRAAPLRLVHAGEQQPHAHVPLAGEEVPQPAADRSARMLRDVEVALTRRHPGLRITADRLDGRPAPALSAAAREAELLVLGSREPGRAAGHLLGSVALAVLGRAERPVVLVPAGAGAGAGAGVPDGQASDGHVPDGQVPDSSGTASGATPYRDIVLGLDHGELHDAVIEFAFEAAECRATPLRIVHGWKEPSDHLAGAAGEPAQEAPEPLTDVLRPWREKFPAVEVIEEAVVGRAGSHLADVSRNASLVVIGHRHRTGPLGALIGPATHAVLRDAVAPVAVVPHD